MLSSSDRPALGRAVGQALAALLAGACASHRAAAPEPAPPRAVATGRAECLIGGDSTGAIGPIPVIARTPEDTGMVRRQWAVPPIRFDCNGAPSPGAAKAWSADSSGLSWTIVLAESAPDAAQVLASWRDSSAAETLHLAGVRWLIPLDLRRIVIELEQPSPELPGVLADSSLAVVMDSGPSGLVLAPAASDPRDALERGAALLRTSDPELVAYARGKAALRVAGLPWSRTYALALPPGAALSLDAAADSAAFRAALARDVVPGEARPAEPPFWWEERVSCSSGAAAPRPRPAGPLLYPAGDSVAAGLAARLVALSDEPGLAARGIPAAAIDSALSHDARAAVVGLPRRALVPCRELRRWPAGTRLVPLVDTRAQAIVRRGTPALMVEHDGTLRPAPTR